MFLNALGLTADRNCDINKNGKRPSFIHHHWLILERERARRACSSHTQWFAALYCHMYRIYILVGCNNYHSRCMWVLNFVKFQIPFLIFCLSGLQDEWQAMQKSRECLASETTLHTGQVNRGTIKCQVRKRDMWNTWQVSFSTHQCIEVPPGVRQPVHLLSIPVAEDQLVAVEQGKWLLHGADGGIYPDLCLSYLSETSSRSSIGLWSLLVKLSTKECMLAEAWLFSSAPQRPGTTLLSQGELEVVCGTGLNPWCRRLASLQSELPFSAWGEQVTHQTDQNLMTPIQYVKQWVNVTNRVGGNLSAERWEGWTGLQEGFHFLLWVLGRTIRVMLYKSERSNMIKSYQIIVYSTSIHRHCVSLFHSWLRTSWLW